MISCWSNHEPDQGTKNLPAFAQAICARHRGIGADGLIVYSTTPSGASMRLLNADGSRSGDLR